MGGSAYLRGSLKWRLTGSGQFTSKQHSFYIPRKSRNLSTAGAKIAAAQKWAPHISKIVQHLNPDGSDSLMEHYNLMDCNGDIYILSYIYSIYGIYVCEIYIWELHEICFGWSLVYLWVLRHSAKCCATIEWDDCEPWRPGCNPGSATW